MDREKEEEFIVLEKPQYVKTGYLRYILSGLLSINLFLLYAERLTLSVAITVMVNSTKTENTTTTSAVCHDPHFVVNSTVDEDVPETKGEFDWDQSQQGMITYAFFVGYLLSQIPGGYLAQRYSVTWVVGLAVGLTSIMTCLTSLAARYHLFALLALRFAEGLGEGVITPSLFVYVTKWIPAQEQGFLLNLIVSGATLGMVLTMPISAMLCNSALGWPAAFYIFGFAGIVSCALWLMFSADGPEHHRWISPAECDYIMKNRPASTKRSPKHVPWKSMLLSPVVLLLCIESFGRTLNFYMILTELPTYLSSIFGINTIKNGFTSGGMNLGSSISLVICGWAADRIILRKLASKNFVRKFCVTMTGVLPAVCLAIMPLVGCNYEVILALIFINCLSLGFTGGGDSMLVLDIAPKFAGTLQGIIGTLGHIGGVVAPLFVATVTNHSNSLHQWNLVFYTIGAFAATGSILFLVFGSTKEQDWAKDAHSQNDDLATLCED